MFVNFVNIANLQKISDGSCWEIIIIKKIHTFTSNILFEQYRIKARATQTETSLLKQYVAGECVDLLDDCKN